MVAPKRNVFAIITLFFVAPLVAEYLLGDLPLKLLAALIVLAPAYGGAANGSWLADNADAGRSLHSDRRRLGDAVALQS
jgi:hypothetical protein